MHHVLLFEINRRDSGITMNTLLQLLFWIMRRKYKHENKKEGVSIDTPSLN